MVGREAHRVRLLALHDGDDELIVKLRVPVVGTNSAKLFVRPLNRTLVAIQPNKWWCKMHATWLVISVFDGLYVVIPRVPTEKIRLYLKK